jgi:TPR repeat protein/serine/threonine protein kinase
MGIVYLAEVNLDRFDYTTLYAYTQVEADTHLERRAKADELTKRLRTCPMDSITVRRLLQAQNIPVPGQYVAIKISSPHGPAQRFTSEWQYLLCLNHPNMISVYEGGQHENQLYYAMEWLDPLIPFERIQEEFSLRHKIRLIQQAAAGLAFMHRAGLVHRDVKPPNILVGGIEADNAIAKISDLGLAKDLTGDGMTLSEQVMGTPRYMAPEQFASARRVDRRADVYSLGAVLYGLVTGAMPYKDHSSVYAVMQAIGRGEPCLPPRRRNPSVTPSISSIIECAMAWEPAARYDDMESFSADLQAYLDAENPAMLECNSYRQAVQLNRLSTAGDAAYGFQSRRGGRAHAAPLPDLAAAPPSVTPTTGSTVRRRTWMQVGFAAAIAVAAVGVLVFFSVLVANWPSSPPPPAQQTPPPPLRAPEKATRVAPPPVAAAPKTAQELYDTAVEATERTSTKRPDYVKAAELLREAAKQGHCRAQTKLGFLLLNGLGIERNYAEAERYFRQASDAGDPEAMCMMGIVYLNGLGRTRNFDEAQRWAAKALALDFPPAKELLDTIAKVKTPPSDDVFQRGVRYLNGKGVEQDFEKALELFRQAAADGHSDAMNEIGSCYLNGRGVKQDFQMAAVWFRRAAAAGSSAGSHNIEFMRRKGLLEE